jgi:hypothetical protein
MKLVGLGVVRLLGLRIVRRCYFLRCRFELSSEAVKVKETEVSVEGRQGGREGGREGCFV